MPEFGVHLDFPPQFLVLVLAEVPPELDDGRRLRGLLIKGIAAVHFYDIHPLH